MPGSCPRGREESENRAEAGGGCEGWEITLEPPGECSHSGLILRTKNISVHSDERH